MCNDSTLEYNTEKRMYTKVGESTETALKVLVEKLNLSKTDRSSLSLEQSANQSSDSIEKTLNKVFTLEFSRERKSMSVYCEPKSEKVPFYSIEAPKLFVKGQFYSVYLANQFLAML